MESDEKIIRFYKKWIEPFIALGIFVMLVLAVVLLNNEHKLKEEISKNCGWAEEDYKCYCKKGDVTEIESIINNNLINPLNITLNN